MADATSRPSDPRAVGYFAGKKLGSEVHAGLEKAGSDVRAGLENAGRDVRHAGRDVRNGLYVLASQVGAGLVLAATVREFGIHLRTRSRARGPRGKGTQVEDVVKATLKKSRDILGPRS
eukprot:tig00000402_g204.t2